MVLESAELLVKAGMQEQFEAGVRQAPPLFQRARGRTGMRLQRGIGGSEDVQEWRRLVGHCFDGVPSVSHLETVFEGF